MPSLYDRLQAEIDRREPRPGLSPADLLELPADLRRLVQELARQGEAGPGELAAPLGLAPDEAARLLDDLVAKGFATEQGPAGTRRYRVDFGRRVERELPLDIWSALAERLDE
jgi:hypothetical protein